MGTAGKGSRKVKDRLNDLFKYRSKSSEHYSHILPKKLNKEVKFQEDTLRNYLYNNCRLKILRTKTIEEALLMESFLIVFLRPKHNLVDLS